MSNRNLFQQQHEVFQKYQKLIAERIESEAIAARNLEQAKATASATLEKDYDEADKAFEKAEALLAWANAIDSARDGPRLAKPSASANIPNLLVPGDEDADDIVHGGLREAETAFQQLKIALNAQVVDNQWIVKRNSAGGWVLRVGGLVFLLLVVLIVVFPSFGGGAEQFQLMFLAFLLALSVGLIAEYIRELYTSFRVRRMFKVLAKNVNIVKRYHPEWRKKAERSYQTRLSEAETAFRTELKSIKEIFQQKSAEVRPEFESVATEATTACPDWSSVVWDTWLPPSDISGAISFGEVCEDPLRWLLDSLDAIFTNRITEPLSIRGLFPFPGERSLLFKTPGSVEKSVIDAIHSFMLRLLTSVPSAKLRFVFVDPVGLGQNVAAFMQLADYDDSLVTSRAWTEKGHIERQLADLSAHMETVIQDYLRNEFETIEDYNIKAEEIREPYRILVVFGFPVNFDDQSARRLLSIAQNGPRCGVYSIVVVNTEQPLPYGMSVEELEQVTTVVEWDGTKFVWKEDDFQHFHVLLHSPPDKELHDTLIRKVGETAVGAQKVKVPFERIAPDVELWWQSKSDYLLSLALGPAGAQKQQKLELGHGTTQHALIVGRTGSGKSTLLHTLITTMALHYSPDQVEVYLIDFKKGVEFKTYATHRLPHARVIAIESEREFGLSVLQGLDVELKRRGDLFRGAGVDDLASYRAKTGEKLPRALLLVDEFQEFFTEDDHIASQSSQILDRLVRQGRSFGMHIVLGTQTLAGTYNLARSTIDQMAVRIALQCSDADSRLILADDNPAARQLSRPGQAIYNAANGMIEGNKFFQVAWLPDEQRDQYLSRIAEKADGLEVAQVVFEGNAPALLENNRPLHRLIGSGLPKLPSYPLQAYLGEPVAIREPSSANFRRQSGSNLLIIGREEEAARGMLVSALLSLATQIPAAHTGSNSAGIDFYVLDLGAADAPNAKMFSHVGEVLPHSVRAVRQRHLSETLSDLEGEIQRRLEAEDFSAASKFLFIIGINRARDLRQNEDFAGYYPSMDDESSAPDPSKLLSTILRDGPEVGIHTLGWCDTMTNLNRSIDRRMMREFAMRVALQMNADDSVNLIDSPAASKLGPNRALFYDDEEVRLEKMRPYRLPSEEWLAWLKSQFS